MSKLRVHLIAAARPNFMKVAPLYHALAATDWCAPILVHTGQHYDVNMSDAFFTDLRLPEPHHHLGVGSGSHAEQTAGVMVAYEKICMDERPDWTIVVGDVNSTIACAMAAAKLWIPIAHLEAGLRSRDRRMPEEINRVLTDSIADVLWTPSPDGDDNLKEEGVPAEKISFVGNIMIDSYELMREAIEAAGTRSRFGLDPQGYAVLTLHRPSNVDTADMLGPLVEGVCQVSERLPLVFAVHPRTRQRLSQFGLDGRLDAAPDVHLTEPMGYVEFMGLVREARFVVTDSGGLQEETTYLDIPCLTLRDNTERPVTVDQGTNRLIKADTLVSSVDEIMAGNWPSGRCPTLWDGQTAGRVAADLKARSKDKLS